MRNDFIGTNIDGDARAACSCQHHGSNTAGCGCDNRQPRPTGCCSHNAQPARPIAKPCGCDDNSRRHDCDDDCSRPRHNHYPCDDDCARYSRTPAMVYAAHHDLDSAYCAEKALLRGTLFGCLDKPMCNERCTDNACFTQCQADKFSIWELRLYLNTHPCDQQALALLNKLTRQMDEDCTCAYTSDCNCCSWIDGPWPWEYQRCCGKEA